jgi:Tfp pilus assembly protein PilP
LRIFDLKDRYKALVCLFLICLLPFLSACKDGGDKGVAKASDRVYKTISRSVSIPAETNNLGKEAENTAEEKTHKVQNRQLKKQEIGNKRKEDANLYAVKSDFYDSKGKPDPFIPLIQEKKRPAPSVQKRPARVLSPLEKIELDQLRLTAIVIMKNKRVAMVEDSTGKGYEISIGTYIGKNKGRVAGINERSIQVTERIKDYNGKSKEQLIEKKLYQYDYED